MIEVRMNYSDHAACLQLYFEGQEVQVLRVNNVTDSPLTHEEFTDEQLNNIAALALSLSGQGPHYTIQYARYSIIIVISLVKTYSRFNIFRICLHIYI